MTLQTKPRILVNRQAALGDVLLTTPIVRKLHEDRNGMCDIDVRTFYPAVYQNNPRVRQILDARLPVRAAEYDLFLNLDLVYERNPRMHIVDAYTHFAFGPETAIERQPELFPAPEDQAAVAALQAETGDAYVVLHMRQGYLRARDLPESLWRDIVERLLAQTALNIVQVGGPQEHAFTGHERLVDLRGRLPLHQLQLVIAGARCFVGGDSGPLHVAATTGTDMVGLYTTARAEYRMPLRHAGRFKAIVPAIDCYGCQAELPLGTTTVTCRRGDEECVNRFDAAEVVAAVLECLSAQADPHAAASFEPSATGLLRTLASEWLVSWVGALRKRG